MTFRVLPCQRARCHSVFEIRAHRSKEKTSRATPERKKPSSLLLVRLVEEDGERDDEEHEHGVNDVYRVPELLHGERQVAGAIHDLALARVAVSDVEGQHQNGQLGDGEAENLEVETGRIPFGGVELGGSTSPMRGGGLIQES